MRNSKTMNLDENPVSEDIGDRDDIFIVYDDTCRPLEIESVEKCIGSICKQMHKEYLNIKKITDNVYPKLKNINTIKDVEDQIVMCASEMVTDHYDYPCIATWILVNDLHDKTHDNYLSTVEELYHNINKKGIPAPIISEGFYEFVKEHYHKINSIICYERDYNISIFGYRTLEKAYLKKTIDGKIIERPQHLYMRVAIALHYQTGNLDRIWETYELLSNGFFTHATPTLFNAGTTHNQLSSCFLMGIADDMEKIGDCWKNCAVTSKYSGGIGIHVTNIRVNGAYIHSTQGTASGLRLLTVFNQIARYADQGGKRAGSIAIYIEPWHGDIFFFLELKKNIGAETERARDLFLALMVNDIFMKRVQEDQIWSLMCPSECSELLDKYGSEFTTIYEKYEKEGKYLKQIPARDLWFRIMESQIESGVPYIVFKDAVNYKSNQINIGVINGSNLCVAGNTMILTSEGYYEIKSLCDRSLDIWNGEEFSRTTIKKTGTNQELVKISFSNGSILNCTSYHKFYLLDKDNTTINKTNAKNLSIGDKIISVSYPIIKNESNICDYPYTHGLFSSNQLFSLYERNCIIRTVIANNITGQNLATINEIILYNDKQQLLKYIDTGSFTEYHDLCEKIILKLSDNHIFDQYFVPINVNLEGKLRWLEGLIDGNDIIMIDNILSLTSLNLIFLRDIKYMLQTMGCDPSIIFGEQEYQLLIGYDDINNLVQLGFKPHTIDIRTKKNLCNSEKEYITVTEIIGLEKTEDTYCFTEPKRGMGIFNGIIAGNCAEIVEVSNESEYAVCTLASICLPKYIKFVDDKPTYDYQLLYKVTRVVTRNLNNIIDINFYPVEETRVSNLKHRPIGIGVQGLADVFAIFKTAFDSELARDLNKKIFETIYFAALSESMTIAREEGPYSTFNDSPLSKGLFQFDLWGLKYTDLSGMWDFNWLRQEIMIYGVRNSLVTAEMPTASTSQIMNNNECFEPYTGNIYTRTTLAGDYYVINEHLMKDLMKLNEWNEDIVDLIKYYKGSIANIPGISDEIKSIYRTAWEIPQKSVIEMAADRGPFVDQTQSMNIFIAKANFAKLNSCLFYAWEKGLKTGMYYLRSKAGSDANQFGIDINKIKELEEKYGIIPDKDESSIAPLANNEPLLCKYVPKHLRKPGDCLSCGS